MNLAVWAERNGVGRASSADQNADLNRQLARVTTQQIPVDTVVSEARSALNGRRKKFHALVGELAVTRIVVDHRDRFCRFGSEYVQAALVVEGGELVVVKSAKVDDDLLRDMTEILTSMCARVNGKRATHNRARPAMSAASHDCEAARW